MLRCPASDASAGVTRSGTYCRQSPGGQAGAPQRHESCLTTTAEFAPMLVYLVVSDVCWRVRRDFRRGEPHIGTAIRHLPAPRRPHGVRIDTDSALAARTASTPHGGPLTIRLRQAAAPFPASAHR